MHCPRCGNRADYGQQFCRSCGLGLEKVAEMLGEESLDQVSSDEIARLRARQLKAERLVDITAFATGGVLLLTLIVVVTSQMIMKGGTIALAGLLVILLFIGAMVMGAFQTYSKRLKEKLSGALSDQNSPASHDISAPPEFPDRALSTVTEGTTELLNTGKGVPTGKIEH